MKFFIDSANLDEIKEVYSWGIVDGITTNPSLIKKAVDSMKKKGRKVSLEKYIKDILKYVSGYSEKTLQRDLIELNNRGIVEKIGERRWSQYILRKTA